MHILKKSLMRNIKSPLACVLVALFVTGCSAIDAAPRTPTENEPLVSQVRAAYNRGFDMVEASFLQQAKNSPYSELEKVITFRREMVRWAELRGEKFYTLESAPRNSVWLVVPPGHHYVDEMIGALQIYAKPELKTLLIQPEKITDLWAGICLIHEISHLRDYYNGIEPINPTRKQFLECEWRAHQLEFMAANLLSKGDIQKRVDEKLARWQPHSHKELIDKFRNINGDEYMKLEEAMQSQRPMSKAEMGLREAFYLSAFMLRYASSNKLDSEAIMNMVADMMALNGSIK
jgi:hypothetical protein